MNLTLIYGTAITMIVVGLGFLFILIGRNEGYRPRGPMEWFGTVLSGLLIATAGTLLVMAMQLEGGGPSYVSRAGSPIEAPPVEDMVINVAADNFEFRLVADDQTAELGAFRGKVILLNFWATWCAPCLVELPELNRLQDNYRDRGLVVLNISDELRMDLLAFHEQLPLNTVSGYMPMPIELPRTFRGGLNVRPATYIIDRDGNIRRFLLGNRSYAFFESAITPYI